MTDPMTDPTTPRPTDAAIALFRDALTGDGMYYLLNDYVHGADVTRADIARALLAHPTLARVIAIGQAWVAAEEAVLGRGAGIEMTVRTLPGAGAVASWYDRVDGEGDRLPSEPTPEAALLALAAALTDQERGSSGVVEQSATQRKHEYHSERTDFDFWCIASCHDDGRCDGECDPDCESCPIPCPLCEAAAPPATGPVVVGTMTEEEGRAFIEAATGTAPPETDTTPHASSVPHATGAVERECVCSVRADDCGLPCPCWHHTPAPAPSPSATGTVERCASDASHDWWLVPSHEAFVCRKCGGGTGVVGGPGHCYPGCFYHPAPAPSPSARVAEVRRQQSAGGGPVTAVRVSRSDDAPSPSAALVEHYRHTVRVVLMADGAASLWCRSCDQYLDALAAALTDQGRGS